MGIGNLFRRRRKADGGWDQPVGLGESIEPDEAGDPMEGGPSVFRLELAQIRWAAQNEAVALARTDLDPLRWRGGQMASNIERGFAHGHEGLRDRLSNYVAKRIRDEIRELYSLAKAVAAERNQLRVIDNELVRVIRDYRHLYDEVSEDPLELGRYRRLCSKTTQDAKKLIAVLFIVAEVIITGSIFEGAIPIDIPLLGFILALGVMGMLVFIPHYIAQGIKEGTTRYYYYEHEEYKQRKEDPPADLDRKVHYEDRDDQGFRLISLSIGLILAILIVPLAALRASALRLGGAPWWLLFFFFLVLQLGISGYFFLREWLDHGTASHNLWKYGELKAELEDERAEVLDGLGEAAAEFHDAAEDLIFTLREAPRWDSYLVETYNETSRYFRHILELERQDLAPFIFWARRPYLGSRRGMQKTDHALDPIVDEHWSLEEASPLGREWWLREISEALADLPDLEDAEGDQDEGERAADVESRDADGADSSEGEEELEPSDVSWLMTKSPSALLREFLSRYFGIEGKYRIPRELFIEDEPDTVPPPEGPSASGAEPKVDDGGGSGGDAMEEDSQALEGGDGPSIRVVPDEDLGDRRESSEADDGKTEGLTSDDTKRDEVLDLSDAGAGGGTP